MVINEVEAHAIEGRRHANSHMFGFPYARCSLLLVEGVVQLAESLEQERSLLLVDVAEFFDGLGGLWGTLGDFLCCAGELATILGLHQDEYFSEVLLLLRLASLGGETDGLLRGETLRRGVVESGEIHGVA